MWFSLLHSKLEVKVKGGEEGRHRVRVCREASARSTEQGMQSSCAARQASDHGDSPLFSWVSRALQGHCKAGMEVPCVDKSLAQGPAPKLVSVTVRVPSSSLL